MGPTFGGPPDVAGFIGGGESGNRDIGYHDLRRSTAAGRYGITDTTWQGLMRTHPELGLNPGNRMDPDANQRAFQTLVAENTSTLQRNGVPTTPLSLYMANFVGPSSAVAAFKADPQTPMGTVLEQAVGRAKAQQMMAANPELLAPGRTVADVTGELTRRMGGGGGTAPQTTPGTVSPAPNTSMLDPTRGPVQPTQAPPMPDTFGAASGAQSQVAQVDRSGREGDPWIGLGMGIMSGANWREGMANGLAGYQKAQSELQSDQQKNAQFKDKAIERDTDAPEKAARAAQLRARAWSELHPTISPDQALNANIALQGQALSSQKADQQIDLQRQQLEEQKRAHDMQNEAMAGKPQTLMMVDPNGEDRTVSAVYDRQGNLQIRDLSNGGQPLNMPPGAKLQDITTYNGNASRQGKLAANADKSVNTMVAEGRAAVGQVESIDRALSSLDAPGANVGNGGFLAAKRTVMSALGMDVTDQSVANMTLSGVALDEMRQRAKGLGSMSDSDRKAFTENLPKIGSDANAARIVLNTLRNATQRKVEMTNRWLGMSPEDQAREKAGGSIDPWMFRQTQAMAEAERTATRTPPPAPVPAPTQRSTVGIAPPVAAPAPGSAGAPVDLNSFMRPR